MTRAVVLPQDFGVISPSAKGWFLCKIFSILCASLSLAGHTIYNRSCNSEDCICASPERGHPETCLCSFSTNKPDLWHVRFILKPKEQWLLEQLSVLQAVERFSDWPPLRELALGLCLLDLWLPRFALREAERYPKNWRILPAQKGARTQCIALPGNDLIWGHSHHLQFSW